MNQMLCQNLFHYYILLSDTSYARNKENGKWYNFDDSHVSETDDSHIVVSKDFYC